MFNQNEMNEETQEASESAQRIVEGMADVIWTRSEDGGAFEDMLDSGS